MNLHNSHDPLNLNNRVIVSGTLIGVCRAEPDSRNYDVKPFLSDGISTNFSLDSLKYEPLLSLTIEEAEEIFKDALNTSRKAGLLT